MLTGVAMPMAAFSQGDRWGGILDSLVREGMHREGR